MATGSKGRTRNAPVTGALFTGRGEKGNSRGKRRTRGSGKGRFTGGRGRGRGKKGGGFWGGLGWLAFWAVVLALAIVGVLALHECKPERLQEERTLTLPEGAELPKWEKQDGGAKDEEIIRHEGFVVSYNPELRLANWVAWALTAEEAQGGVAERTDDFRPDPNLKGASAQTGDYKNSGYDRGHLAPAGDMGWSETAMRESFYLTNICPQSPSLNRGLWRVVEERCREWATEYGVALIVAGPVVQADGERIGENGVAVPQFFYKVICRLSDNKYHGIAFLLENRAYGKTDWRELAIPIDSVEGVTGLDFFPLLPDREEEAMERMVEADKW